MKKILTLAVFLMLYLAATGQDTKSVESEPNNTTRLRAVAEIGFLGVLDHKVQFSNNGTYFDYKEDGGQDVLFPVNRFSIELDFNKRNTLVFLYQPLRLESQVLLENNLVVDDLTFPASTSVKLLYIFLFTGLVICENYYWKMKNINSQLEELCKFVTPPFHLNHLMEPDFERTGTWVSFLL